MSNRKLHRLLGIALLAPLLAWSITGLVFLIQPGYGQAYSRLQVRSYALATPLTLPVQAEWLEYRVLQTILGMHLLVRTEDGWNQHDPATLAALPEPSQENQFRLINDAIAGNPERYGTLSSYSEGVFHTSTGVEIRLNWSDLSLLQQGRDTRWIDRFYQLHYLQWTGIRVIDKVLGVLGLLLLITSSVTGFRLLRNGRNSSGRAW